MVAEKTIAEDKEALNRLIQKVTELVITYKTAKQLLHTDVTVIRRAAKKNSTIKYPYEVTSAYHFFSFRGGLSPFLLRRRIRRMVEDILSTCYLYFYFEEDSEKKEMAQKVIDEIKKDETSIIVGTTTASKTDSVKLSLEICSIILGFVALPILLPLQTQINQAFVGMYSPVMWPPIILALEIPLFWLIPKLGWYRKVTKACNLKTKEMNIYNDLLLLQKKMSSSPLIPSGFRKIIDYKKENK